MMCSRPGRPVATFVAIVAVAVCASSMASCATGERPAFRDEIEPEVEAVSTGNADIDAVLERLDGAERSTFTATYTIETKFGSLSSTATVVEAGDGRSAVTIERPAGTTRFIVGDDGARTCDLATGDCEPELNDARISDVGIPHSFYGPSFARRLRVSADRRIGGSQAYVEQITGRDASCVDVTVAGGTETFCALDSGALAEFVGADVTVTLTDYSPEPDESQLTI